MRIGANPVKNKQPAISPPKPVTVVVICYIPYLSGYFQHSLDVLKLSLNSIWKNTADEEYDLLVFDNGSCDQVRDYLTNLKNENKIQYLILSSTNVGIPGAWNISFNAAPGKYVAFSDYDIYFYPGWLNEHLNILNNFPDVGMVTGTPIRPPLEFSTATLEWAEAQTELEIKRGVLQSWDDYRTHTKSLGMSQMESEESYQMGEDILLKLGENEVFIGAGHFQFVASKEVLEKVTPFPNKIAMGNERLLDQRINELGLLRLTLTRKFVQHLGNVPPQELLAQNEGFKKKNTPDGSVGNKAGFWNIPILKRVLLKIYNSIFEIYFHQ
jgi:glycosyltransferase involved in cell wall biosynthesis